MSTDRYAGDVSTESPAAREAFGRFVRALVAHRADTSEQLDAALAADPGLVPALALKGFGLRSLGRRALLRDVLAYARRARACLDPGRPRDRALVDALDRWAADDGPGAAELLDAQLAREPADLLVAKLSHGLRFMNGDPAGMLRSVGRALEGFDDDDPERAWLLGCRAFALCENGLLDEADAVGREAVEREPADVWGIHAVAHVCFMRSAHGVGARWLAAHRAPLAGGNNFSGHVAWHEALFLVELGRAQEALRCLDERVTVYDSGDYREASNACSMLFRLEQRGLDVGDRWGRWVELARARLGDHGSAFADAHYALALARAGRPGEAAAFLRALRDAIAALPEGHDARVSREVGAPLCEAIVGGRAEPIVALHDALPRLGGSCAQRALFDWVIERARSVAGTQAAAAEA